MGEIKPNPGPQWDAFESEADILIYGGGAGGGKSWYLVAEPLRHRKRSGFRGVIFRRNYPQITGQGGLWDEAQSLYPRVGGQLVGGNTLRAKFPSGASVSFRHLQHEKTKYEYQGQQFSYIGFDELTHFSEEQFFYLIGRMRTGCGIKPYLRATCNPEPGWVADFIDWWIDPATGYVIPERCGVVRYFLRDTSGLDEKIVWADSAEELLEKYPTFKRKNIKSATFIEAKLEDNPHLDEGYEGNLMLLSRVERERLLGRNWKVSEGSVIEPEWFQKYSIEDEQIVFQFQGIDFQVPVSSFRRIATIDTAGTSKEKAAEKKGTPASYSVCAIWDTLPHYVTLVDGKRFVLSELLFLRHVWRAQVEWNRLRVEVPEVLQSWAVSRTHIEKAHCAVQLAAEIKSCRVDLIPTKIPGMAPGGAKLERAIASGMLTRVENGKMFVPEESSTWRDAYLRELSVWTGLPKETADQIDVTSHACHVTKRASAGGWGGTVKQAGVRGTQNQG